MPSKRSAVFAGALACYALALGAGLFEPAPPTLAGTSLLRLGPGLALLQTLIVSVLLELLRFLPLGVLATCALPATQASGVARSFTRASALALAAACGALVLRGAGIGQLIQGLGALSGVPIGVSAALSWQLGQRARRLFLPRLAALAVLLMAGGFGATLLLLDAAPALDQRAPISSQQRRLLVRHFRGKDPRKIPPGEQRSLTLSATELDQLVQWGGAAALHARSQLSLRSGGGSITVSLPVPRTSRWLNMRAESQLALVDNEFVFSEARLSLGSLPVPAALAGWGASLLLGRLQQDRDARRVLSGFKELALSPERAVLSYGAIDMPKQLAARLMWGEDSSDELRATVQLHVAHLLEELPSVAPGDARFAAALTTTFALARARSVPGTYVDENRAALLALGIVFGHAKLVRFLGERFDLQRSLAIAALREQTTLRGRADWSRHFTVSAALTVISAVAPSDAAGLLKEELDADGGSGFSFADLLADRAGTSLAERATRDDASAAALQRRLALGFLLEDFFPDAQGLPENIPDRELSARYGGVGGPGFRALMTEIERRVGRCAAYGE